VFSPANISAKSPSSRGGAARPGIHTYPHRPSGRRGRRDKLAMATSHVTNSIPTEDAEWRRHVRDIRLLCCRPLSHSSSSPPILSVAAPLRLLGETSLSSSHRAFFCAVVSLADDGEAGTAVWDAGGPLRSNGSSEGEPRHRGLIKIQ
jgi:hypothetical protein